MKWFLKVDLEAFSSAPSADCHVLFTGRDSPSNATNPFIIFFLKVKWFNWWQICCVLNAPFFPAGCCALFESVPAVVVCERKWCFHSVKRLNIPPNKVFHSSTWLVHSLWWLNEVTWQCLLLLDIFSLLLKKKKKSKHYASLQPTGAAGHTACWIVTPRGFSVSVSSPSGYFIQRLIECGTWKYEFHRKKRKKIKVLHIKRI